MWYLYLGYVVIQFYAIIDVFSRNSLAVSAVLFSIVVFIIWSFIPILGYILAKALGAKGYAKRIPLLLCGVIIGLSENALTYFNLIAEKQYNIGTALVFILCFVIAYLPLNRQELAS
ncbi:hypothetical protein [Colwellia psychrerythraea]|uniref:Uncharacterized protein n=1 Tax=Colwellia psychrerythraea TaxID=28229 RepID=A0A099KUB3_COLPS|nr:hypothetical protein [Colwellia psychrerythraea]KGJ94364.1 hypothetical protein ND2E_1553 [Colwellia psychrerythraea]